MAIYGLKSDQVQNRPKNGISIYNINNIRNNISKERERYFVSFVRYVMAEPSKMVGQVVELAYKVDYDKYDSMKVRIVGFEHDPYARLFQPPLGYRWDGWWFARPAG